MISLDLQSPASARVSSTNETDLTFDDLVKQQRRSIFRADMPSCINIPLSLGQLHTSDGRRCRKFDP